MWHLLLDVDITCQNVQEMLSWNVGVHFCNMMAYTSYLMTETGKLVSLWMCQVMRKGLWDLWGKKVASNLAPRTINLLHDFLLNHSRWSQGKNKQHVGWDSEFLLNRFVSETASWKVLCLQWSRNIYPIENNIRHNDCYVCEAKYVASV